MSTELPPPELPYTPGTPEFEKWAAEDIGPSSLALCWTFTVMATFFVAARLYTRLSMFHNLKSDDYWCGAGLICAYLATIFTTISVDYGNGRHYQILSMHAQEEIRRWTLAAFVPSVMCFCLPKFAVVTLLTRLLNPSRLHRWFLWGMTIVLFLSLVAAIGLLLGQCKPVAVIWDFTLLPQMKCIDPNIYVSYSIYVGALSAFIDFYLAIYPGVVLFKLQMKLQKKLALTFALSIGCLGGALAIYKTARFHRDLRKADYSYETADLINWTILEGATIIIASTIPVLSPLMDRIFRRYNPFSSSRKSSRRSTSKGRNYFQNGHSGSGDSGAPEMDERAPRRAPLDPLDPEMDLAETIVGNESDEYLSTMDREKKRKMQLEDLEAQRSATPEAPRHSRTSSASTQIAADSPHLGQRQTSASPTDGIMRTNEVCVTIGLGSPRDLDQERLNRNIPWETAPTPSQSRWSP